MAGRSAGRVASLPLLQRALLSQSCSLSAAVHALRSRPAASTNACAPRCCIRSFASSTGSASSLSTPSSMSSDSDQISAFSSMLDAVLAALRGPPSARAFFAQNPAAKAMIIEARRMSVNSAQLAMLKDADKLRSLRKLLSDPTMLAMLRSNPLLKRLVPAQVMDQLNNPQVRNMILAIAERPELLDKMIEVARLAKDVDVDELTASAAAQAAPATTTTATAAGVVEAEIVLPEHTQAPASPSPYYAAKHAQADAQTAAAHAPSAAAAAASPDSEERSAAAATATSTTTASSSSSSSTSLPPPPPPPSSRPPSDRDLLTPAERTAFRATDLLIGVAIGILLYKLIEFLFDSPAVIADVLSAASEDALVAEKVGSKIKQKGLWTGNVNAHDAAVNVPISGDKGIEAVLHARGLYDQHSRAWKILLLQVSFPDEGAQRHTVEIPDRYIIKPRYVSPEEAMAMKKRFDDMQQKMKEQHADKGTAMPTAAATQAQQQQQQWK